MDLINLFYKLRVRLQLFPLQYCNFKAHISIQLLLAGLSLISWLHYHASDSNRVEEAVSTQAQKIPGGATVTTQALWCSANWMCSQERFGATPEHTAASVTEDKKDKRWSGNSHSHMGKCLSKGAFPTDSQTLFSLFYSDFNFCYSHFL